MRRSIPALIDDASAHVALVNVRRQHRWRQRTSSQST